MSKTPLHGDFKPDRPQRTSTSVPKPSSNLQKLALDPRRILLLDMFGALITAFVTWALLSSELLPTGLPVACLRAMAAVALGFACFDAAGLFLALEARNPLKVIAVLNLLYCGFSVVICCVYSEDLTRLGRFYFSVEVVLVAGLACWEWMLASRPSSIRF